MYTNTQYNSYNTHVVGMISGHGTFSVQTSFSLESIKLLVFVIFNFDTYNRGTTIRVVNTICQVSNKATVRYDDYVCCTTPVTVFMTVPPNTARKWVPPKACYLFVSQGVITNKTVKL